jgi:hypothetical protein
MERASNDTACISINVGYDNNITGEVVVPWPANYHILCQNTGIRSF